jgi:hypothetical protein
MGTPTGKTVVPAWPWARYEIFNASQAQPNSDGCPTGGPGLGAGPVALTLDLEAKKQELKRKLNLLRHCPAQYRATGEGSRPAWFRLIRGRGHGEAEGLSGWAGWTRSRLPELLVQPPRTLEELRRVSVRDRARNGDQRCAVEQGLAVIGLDRGVAFLAGVPLAPGRVHPLHDSAATEVATRHRSTVSNTRSTALETVTPALRDLCCTGSNAGAVAS